MLVRTRTYAHMLMRPLIPKTVINE
ncbi:hypothetical protein BCEN4_820048 [Burkholderia cenocepacia]|nr:hypothetical protein BCEN4_820048 [Burkholderia cenocepacia]